MSRALLLLAALLLAAPARADSLADEADFRFRRAATLYREGRIEDALGEFLASNRLVRNRNVIFNIARSFEKLAKFNEAYRWYTEIWNDDMPQGDRRDLQEALKRLQPSLALLQVESEPPGATVYVDRKDLGARGQTPVTLALPPGKVTAILELAGFRPFEQSLTLAIGRTVSVRPWLDRIYGTLAVMGEPAGFEVQVDQGPPLILEQGMAKVIPGRHILTIVAPGHAAEQLAVEVPPYGATPVKFKLLPLPPPAGALVVRANLDGALVRVDGQDVGFTPGVIDKVRVGRHKLEVIADGREPYSTTVEVKQDERLPVEVKLLYSVPRVQAAERQVTRAQDAPASISIISWQEIRGFGYTTLAEALRSVRGLFISDDRDYLSLGVRGFSPPGTYNNRVLVLADGHITNDLSLGQGFTGHDFDTDLTDVERIEIVRGPGSVLYGSAAYLAVVNVVHRTPAPGIHAAGGATFLSENAASAVVSGAREQQWIAMHGGVYHSDGEQLFHSPSLPGFASGLDGEDAAHADLRGHSGEVTFFASVNDRGKTLPTAPFDTVFGAPGTTTHDTRFFGELSWTHPLAWGGSLDMRLSLDGRRHSATLQYRGVDPARAYPGDNGRIADWGEGEARLRLPTFLGNSIFVGGEVQDVWRVRLSSFTPAGSDAGNSVAPDVNYRETVLSAYAGDDLRLGPHATLHAAVRLDDHPDSFGTVANPRLALITQPYEGGNFKLMYGTAYRAPSFYERYFQNGVTEVPGNRCLANGTCLELQPETIRTGEFEHTHFIGDSLSLLLAGYWSRIANILRLAQISKTQFAFGNRSTLTHSSGIEAEARWQPEPGKLVAVWYAFAHVTNDNGFLVPNVPTHTAALRALWPVTPELLSVSTELIYGSKRWTAFVDNNNVEHEVGEELIWNAGFTGTLGERGPRFTMVVQNLLDQRPLIPAGLEVPFAPRAVPQAGRLFRATLSGSF